MGDRRTAAEIDAVAATWVARLDRSTLSTDEQGRLADWLAEDVRNRGAFIRARAVFLHADRARALGPTYRPDHFRSAIPDFPLAALAPSRRRLVTGGAASVTAAGVTFALMSGGASFATGLGEVRLVPLQDGSVATLNTESRLNVRFTRNRRVVRLLKGEVLFEVSRNAARPFIVYTDDVMVGLVGATFTIRRREDGAIQVLVSEGSVDVTRMTPMWRGAPQRDAVRLASDETLIVERRVALRPNLVDAKAAARALAWREGMISFEDTPLAAAAKEFARYSNLRIVIKDPQVGAETVTGLFSAGNPVGFARSAALALELNVRTESDGVYLTR